MDLFDYDLLELEDTVAIATQPIQLSSYDFDFRSHFHCRSLIYGTPKPIIARIGAIDDYDACFQAFLQQGLRLIHDPQTHQRAASICGWEPLLRGLTPETVVWDQLPPVEQVSARFGWPVFIKGDRQTSRHRAELCIARGPADYERICAAWQSDRILHWQKPAIRRFVPLRRVGDRPEGLQASFEFRVFCYQGQVVGSGRYWTSHTYNASPSEQDAIHRLAQLAAARVDVPFLVVDIAQTAEGDWIVIECNDAQESSYGGVVPLSLWSSLLTCI